MKIINRPQYLEKLERVSETPDIKVITGVRRSGKSTLLQSYMHRIKENDASANIIHIDFNNVEFEHLIEYHSLYEHVEKSYRSGKNNYVVIDEVQMCQGFEKVVNSLHATGKYDIYLTGSNAFLMSSDLATLFTGRTYSIEVYPFSLSEYADYFDIDDVENGFDSYVREGGMPGSYAYRSFDDKMHYVAEVFDTLILRDIVQKHGIRNSETLDRVADFMMDNISNVSSASSVASALDGKKDSNLDKTVSSYLKYLCEAFAFYKVRRFDIKGKRYLSYGDKFYLSDHSFRYAKLGTRNMDFGRVYENIVAIELMRRGWEVYAGNLYKKEIDFVATRRNEKIYIQVSDDISTPETFERECGPLLKIRDAYPKILIARTRHETYTYEGISILNIADWLLDI